MNEFKAEGEYEACKKLECTMQQYTASGIKRPNKNENPKNNKIPRYGATKRSTQQIPKHTIKINCICEGISRLAHKTANKLQLLLYIIRTKILLYGCHRQAGVCWKQLDSEPFRERDKTKKLR